MLTPHFVIKIIIYVYNIKLIGYFSTIRGNKPIQTRLDWIKGREAVLGQVHWPNELNPGAKREEEGNPVTVLIPGLCQLRIASIPERSEGLLT